MKISQNQLLAEALQLDEDERAELAVSLIESLDGAADADAEQAWKLELDRRLETLDKGEADLVSWGDVKDRLTKKLNG